MKIALILLLMITSMVTSQEKEDIIDKVAKETCEYLSSDEVKGLSGEPLAMKMGIKIFQLYGQYTKELNEAGVVFDSSNAEESGRKLGEKVGLNMVKFCPEVLMALADSQGLLDETDNTEMIDKSTFLEDKSINGVIKKMEGDDIVTLVVKDESGKTQKFLWLENFSGSDKLIEAKKVNKLKVMVYYKSIEVYSPKLKEYVVKKQITRIDYL
jgi:hypothetical protein